MSEEKTLLFFIDTTGSMGSWISAIVVALPSLVRSVALTQVFDKIQIVSYKDYDVSNVVEFSILCNCAKPEEVQELQNFAKSLKPTGGGGAPEAFKTGLLRIIEQTKISGKLFIIHLTDAPPHVEGSLDSQGVKEKQLLKEKFDYFTLVNLFTSNFTKLRFCTLCTNAHPFYCYLANKIEGSVHLLTGGTSPENIRNKITMLLNTWFGFDNGFENQIKLQNSNDVEKIDEPKLAKKQIHTVNEIESDDTLSRALFDTIAKLKTDENFLENVIHEMGDIIEIDPISLTISPILGKMWRELCKRRHDTRRDDLISLLNKRKSALPDADKNVIDEWLKDSYNSVAEIEEDLIKWLNNNPVTGLLRFLPENEDLCAQKMVQLLAAGDKKSTTVIRAILTRMYIDENFNLPKCNLSDDDDGIPLPERSLPLNLPKHQLFELILHTVAPGTKLTRRYAALLALHSILCNCILKNHAIEFLNSIKGKWINWSRRADGTIEVPECWSMLFLSLILRDETQFCLTEQELKDALYYRRIGFALRFYRQLEVSVKIIDVTSLDGVFPDHQIECVSCSQSRPLTIINANGKCGYCCSDNGTVVIEKYLSTRCYFCGSIYNRDYSAYIPGYSKCYECRASEGAKSSPFVTCNTCQLNFVQPYKTDEGLPNNQCGPCSQGVKARELQYKEYPVLSHQVVPSSYFPALCKSVGLEFICENELNSSAALYDVIEFFKVLDECEVAAPPDEIVFRNAKVQNISDIWNELINIMSGSKVPTLPECSICLELKPTGQINLACGRKGCPQRVCNECAEQWYGINTPGNLIYQRAILCQFCSRVPSPKTLARINPRLISLASFASKNKLDPDIYYAWCRVCFQPEEYARHECAQVAPNVENHTCNACGNTPAKNNSDNPDSFKECPKCTVMTEKISGCNHILCSSCNTHWCWKCSAIEESADLLYSHLSEAHGGFFDEDAYFDEYDDEFDD